MRKKQAKTVEFSNLSEDHKAQFLQFLIKNNICFQEGKQNCTAKIAIKPTNTSKPSNTQGSKQKSVSKKQKYQGHQNKLHTTSERKSINSSFKRESKPLGQLTLRNNTSYETAIEQKELKTPTKQSGALRISSLSCKEGSQTLQKRTKNTPKSVKPAKNRIKEHTLVNDYDPKAKSLKKTNLKEFKDKSEVSKQKHQNTHEKQRNQSFCKPARKSEVGVENPCSKYASLFDSLGKGRPVRWPLGLLERTIEEIYDQIFLKNTQCLQNKNIQNALRTLHLSTFPQLIENYFFKKYKNSKLASTNLSNLAYSLSYHVSKTTTPCFLKTFEDFLMDSLQYEDALYYLFARNVLKKELKAVERARELSRVEGTYFPDKIKQKDIPKLLKGIIGRDSELLNEYKELVQSRMAGDQIQAYQFLRILLDDFHQRRLFNEEVEQAQSIQDRPLFDRDESYDRRNQELTFGEEQYNHSEACYRPQFWECLAYSHISDSLFQLIIDKLSKKAIEFLEILAGDTEKSQPQLQRLQILLLLKAESLVKAVFEMNKMKWFRELSIADPSEQDMATVENVQMRLRRLREAPSGKDIGQFCKSILTVPQLVNELQFSITPNDS